MEILWGILNDIHVGILQGVCGNVLSETDSFSQRFCFLLGNEVQFAVKTFLPQVSWKTYCFINPILVLWQGLCGSACFSGQSCSAMRTVPNPHWSSFLVWEMSERMSPKLCDKIALVINKFGLSVFLPLDPRPICAELSYYHHKLHSLNPLPHYCRDKMRMKRKTVQHTIVLVLKLWNHKKCFCRIEGVWYDYDRSFQNNETN